MKISLLTLCLFIIKLEVNSQDVQDPVLENTFLWEVTGPSLTTPSYIYGTTHSSCENDVVLSPALLQKLQSARIFFIETLAWKQAEDSGFVEGQTQNGVKEMIGDRCFKKAKKILEKYYGPLNERRLDSMNTVEFGKLLKNASQGCRIISYDDSLYNLAKKFNLDIRGLESLSELKKSMPKDTDIAPDRRWICNYIDYDKFHKPEYRKHITMYKNKDINWLYKQAAYTPGGDQSSFKDKYLDGRNKLWLPRIETAMKEGPSFFAFGCAHLGGHFGIISLLRKEGYTVTPVF
jgi:uncharacterized protein YbaP (TraB family)